MFLFLDVVNGPVNCLDIFFQQDFLISTSESD